MTYRVVISNEALGAIEAQAVYLLESGAPEARVGAWMRRLLDVIDSLETWPHRFAVAEEVSQALGKTIRRVNVDEYALYYRVCEDTGVVEIMAMRHGRRRPWRGEIEP